MATLEIPDVSPEMLEFLDKRAAEAQSGSRAEYVRTLILKDFHREHLAAPTTFRDLLDPIHQQVAASAMTDEEVDTLFSEARDLVRAGKQP